jgi:TonB family protein
MRHTFTLLFLFSFLYTHATGDEYFVDFDKKRCVPEAGSYYRVVKKENEVWQVKDYYINERSLQMDGQYADDSLQVPVGMFYWHHNNKQLERKGRFIEGKMEGMWKAYSTDGKLTDSSLYKNGDPYKFSYRWHDNGNKKFIGVYNDDGSGEETAYYEDGKLDMYGKYTTGYDKDSIWTYNYKNGKIASREYFEKGRLVKLECFTVAGMMDVCDIDLDTANYRLKEKKERQDKDMVYSYTDVMPKADYNVNRYLSMTINYPASARENDVEGKVYVQFIVNEDGKITDPKLVGNGKAGGGLDEEALRVVGQMPKWKPGKVHHRPVKVYFTLPISFKLG